MSEMKMRMFAMAEPAGEHRLTEGETPRHRHANHRPGYSVARGTHAQLDAPPAQGGARAPFYAWIDEGETPTLAIDGVIDTGVGWYEDTVTPRAFREALDGYAGRDILVSINSPGGDVFAGFEIYNMLAHRRGRTTVRVVGMAASAASYIAMAASPGRLHMCEASMMMIHSPWGGLCGNAQAMREQADVLDEIEAIMTGIYMRRFAGSEDELRAMLRAERYMSPTEAHALGLCDEIVAPFEVDADAERAAAAVMAGRYAALDRGALTALRVRLGLPERTPAAAPPPAPDYLAMADAAIATML